MADMSFFEKAIRYQDKITLLDLLSGAKVKHTRQDRENILLTGTSIDAAATESVMLQKWQLPWFFMQVLIAGLVFSAILIACVLFTGNTAVILVYIMFCSSVVPVTLMIFFWEINVPRNISIFQLIVCFVTGGVFSIAVSLVLGDMMDIWAFSFLAPLAEEPGKLIISLLILKRLCGKKGFKIYGMSGLTIGAAVGAGFAAFETAQYVYNFGLLWPLLIRSLCALVSHVMYCAPYVTVAALLMENGTFGLEFLKNKYFGRVFLFSCAMHAIWNFFASYFFWPVFTVELFLEWKLVTRLIQECFRQIAKNVGTVTGASVLATNFRLRCINGVHAGKVFALKQDNILIGTDSSCNLVYPIGTLGISDRQCKMVVQDGNLYLADAGSREGTYLNGIRLKPLKGQLLQKGDVFWLGSEREKFKVEVTV